MRSNLSGSAAFRVTKRSRPPSKIPWATRMAQLEWMLYGGNLHELGPNEGKQARTPYTVRLRSVRLIGGDLPGSKEPVAPASVWFFSVLLRPMCERPRRITWTNRNSKKKKTT